MEQDGLCFWFTGISGAGKTTLANLFSKELDKLGYKTCVLDGDIIRNGLCSDLGMSIPDRAENNRRAREVAKLLVDAKLFVFSAFTSPRIEDREKARKLIGESRFIEIYVSTPVSVCRQRDPKGLYKLLEDGKISNMVGADLPYIPPKSPHITIDTSKLSSAEAKNILLDFFFGTTKYKKNSTILNKI